MAIKRSSTKRHKFTADLIDTKQSSCKIHPREAMLRPVAGVCTIAEEQRRNNAQTNTEIRHGKLNNKPVGLGAKISFAANEEDCKSNDG